MKVVYQRPINEKLDEQIRIAKQNRKKIEYIILDQSEFDELILFFRKAFKYERYIIEDMYEVRGCSYDGVEIRLEN